MSCKRNSAANNCRNRRETINGTELHSLKEIVSFYRKQHYDALERELGDFKGVYKEKGLKELIRTSAGGKALQTGKTMPHQSFIPENSLQQWMDKLSGIAEEIARCHTFEQLHKRLETEMTNVYGIGSLTCYDTALRIAYALGFPPRDYVYLHAGAQLPGEKAQKNGCIAVNVLTKDITEELPAYHIENMLCLYKDNLAPFGSLKKNKTK